MANLTQQLKRIKTAKARADELTETLSPGHNAAQAVIAIAWEALFDHFCSVDSAGYEISELSTLSSVIQRLISANTAIKTLEQKIEEHLARVEDRETEKQRIADELRRASDTTGGLSAEALADIEAALNLL